MASGLSDDELRAAAAEAGISPQELRHALAERQGTDLGTDLVRPEDARMSVLGPPTRGSSAEHAEARVKLPPEQALAAVRKSIERQTGKSGHKQGDGEADIVDDDARVTYRLRAQADGGGGSLVRVDVDPSAGKGLAALGSIGTLGLTVLLVGVGALISNTILLLGLGLGAVGGLLLGRLMLKLRAATAGAHAIASHALMEADDGAARVLPPGSAPGGALPPGSA